jgi:hypothetical protein
MAEMNSAKAKYSFIIAWAAICLMLLAFLEVIPPDFLPWVIITSLVLLLSLTGLVLGMLGRSSRKQGIVWTGIVLNGVCFLTSSIVAVLIVIQIVSLRDS